MTRVASPRSVAQHMKFVRDSVWEVTHLSESQAKHAWSVPIESNKHGVYIFKCTGKALVDVPAKAKSVVIDSCKDITVKVSGVIASVELVNCEKITLAVTASVPTVTIDKCSGVNLYFANDTWSNCQITTNRWSEVTLHVQSETDGEFHEVAVPEQFTHTLVTGKKPSLLTKVCDLYR